MCSDRYKLATARYYVWRSDEEVATALHFSFRDGACYVTRRRGQRWLNSDATIGYPSLSDRVSASGAVIPWDTVRWWWIWMSMFVTMFWTLYIALSFVKPYVSEIGSTSFVRWQDQILLCLPPRCSKSQTLQVGAFLLILQNEPQLVCDENRTLLWKHSTENVSDCVCLLHVRPTLLHVTAFVVQTEYRRPASGSTVEQVRTALVWRLDGPVVRAVTVTEIISCCLIER
jgi:hypothetical protein